MPVKFKANIEENKIEDGWVIRLIDTVDNREVVSSSLEEFSKNIELFGEDYGGDIEVIWSKDKDVTDKHFKEIHDGMASYKEDNI